MRKIRVINISLLGLLWMMIVLEFGYAESCVEDIAGIDDLKRMEHWPDVKRAIEQEVSSLAENDTW